MKFSKGSFFTNDGILYLIYPKLEFEAVVGETPATWWDPPEPITEWVTVKDYEYEIEDCFDFLIEQCIDWDDYPDVDYENDKEVNNFVLNNFDELVEKYIKELFDHYEEEATEKATQEYEDNLDDWWYE